MEVYPSDLTRCCGLLAAGLELGRHCDRLAPGLRRFEAGKHVIFYLQEPDRIVVVRILHQQALPTPASFKGSWNVEIAPKSRTKSASDR